LTAAQDHFTDLVAGNLGPLQGGPDGDFAELVRRKGGEGAVEGPHRGAGGRNDDDVFHENLPLAQICYGA